jgi:transposase-like protein
MNASVSPFPASPQRTTGRKSKFTAELRAKILRLAAKGMPLTHISSACGISHQAFRNYRRDRPEFEAALLQAISRGMEKRLAVIEKAMDSQDESIRLRAATWYLEHVHSEHFSKTRIEVEAVGQFDHAFVIPRETLDQIAEARAKHERELHGNGSTTALPEIKTADIAAP